MEFKANPGKSVDIEVKGEKYLRNAIETHYVQIGENYLEIIEKYVKPIYEDGDIVSISEKIIGLCQKRVVYKKDIKISGLAKFLSKFAMKSDAGVGVDNPYKMQFAINLCGRFKVIWAAVAGGFAKLFGRHGTFYRIVGPEISGLDGFYGDVFEDYAEFGIRIPDNSTGVCNEMYEKLGIKAMIVDANDFNVEILGKSDKIELSDEDLAEIIKDNPAGQAKTLTPLILIRKSIKQDGAEKQKVEENSVQKDVARNDNKE
ncbi:MAG: F420-0--gamma-glutamyl ligase [Clostridia bacterium]